MNWITTQPPEAGGSLGYGESPGFPFSRERREKHNDVRHFVAPMSCEKIMEKVLAIVI